MADQSETKPKQEIRRREDLLSVYANSCNFEPSSFDLKLIFGNLDQQGGKQIIEQHTAVTISWMEAKLLSFVLQFQIAAYELENGKVRLPSRALPPEAPPIPKELENDPTAQKIRETLVKMREEFIANL